MSLDIGKHLISPYWEGYSGASTEACGLGNAKPVRIRKPQLTGSGGEEPTSFGDSTA